MRFRIKETRHTRNLSVEIPVTSSEEEFVGLLDANNSPKDLKPVIEDAWNGLKVGRAPELCEEGVGGTYFMHNVAGKKIAVFKPQDEEPYNVNNPKGYRPRRGSEVGIREGILVGEAALRECAAYLLDHDNFTKVPVTDLVLCNHHAFYKERIVLKEELEYEEVIRSPRLPPTSKIKLGSFQSFIQHDGNCEEIGPAMISKFPVEEVQKIAQLDIRLMNNDRHGGNILYRKIKNSQGDLTYELIPIDHGYTLPSTLDEAWFEWLHWPQAKQKISEPVLEYIKKLDVDHEISLLKKKFDNTIRDEHIGNFKIANILLKKAASAGLTFYQIGSMIVRSKLTVPSLLEGMCEKATKRSSIDGKTKDTKFFVCLAEIMDEEIKSILGKEEELGSRR